MRAGTGSCTGVFWLGKSIVCTKTAQVAPREEDLGGRFGGKIEDWEKIFKVGKNVGGANELKCRVQGGASGWARRLYACCEAKTTTIEAQGRCVLTVSSVGSKLARMW